MEIQPITYHGRTVAACTPQRFFLSDEMERRLPDDPELNFVLAMVLYARDVAHGRQPGPYTDADAVRARAARPDPGRAARAPHARNRHRRR
jgi:hypothetical protein